MKNAKTSHLESTPIGTKTPDPNPRTQPTESLKARDEIPYQRTRSQTHHCQTRHRANMIRPMTANIASLEARTNMVRMMTENTANPKSRNAIKIKIIGNAQNRNHQTHRQETLIFPTKVIINLRDVIRRRAIGKSTLSNYAQS